MPSEGPMRPYKWRPKSLAKLKLIVYKFRWKDKEKIQNYKRHLRRRRCLFIKSGTKQIRTADLLRVNRKNHYVCNHGQIHKLFSHQRDSMRKKIDYLCSYVAACLKANRVCTLKAPPS